MDEGVRKTYTLQKFVVVERNDDILEIKFNGSEETVVGLQAHGESGEEQLVVYLTATSSAAPTDWNTTDDESKGALLQAQSVSTVGDITTVVTSVERPKIPRPPLPPPTPPKRTVVNVSVED